MQSNRVRTGLLAVALAMTPGILPAEESGSDEAILGATPLLAAWGDSYPAPSIDFSLAASPSLLLPEPAPSTFLTSRFLRPLADKMVFETYRYSPAVNRQAFQSTGWGGYQDTYLEELRSEHAKNLMTEALDEYLEDRLDQALKSSPGFRRVGVLIERVESFDLRSKLGRAKRRPAEPGKRRAAPAVRQPKRFDGDVELRVSSHPKVRFKARWGRLQGRVDVPLTGDNLRLQLRHSLRRRYAAALESRLPLREGGSAWTTLALSIAF